MGLAFAAAPALAAPSIYWAGYGLGTIGHAQINGSDADANFVTGASTPCADIAVTRTYVYWSNYSSDTIGRAALNGTDVNQSFITGVSGPCGITAYAGHLYWANYNNDTIGSANLNGTGVNEGLITGASDPCGIAADAGRLYWGNYGTIGRASISGSAVNQSFITGIDDACSVAVTATNVYWAAKTDGTIGRANLSGAAINRDFITDAPGVCGLGIGPPSTATKLRASRNPSSTHKSVTYTATVGPKAPDAGAIRFTNGTHTIHGCARVRISIVTGRATCRVSLHLGREALDSATYSGSAVFTGSHSAALKQLVKHATHRRK